MRCFRALIALLFADRGLHIPGEALRFMVERLERDYWAAERAVEAIDRFAIAERARLTLPTIRRALADANLIGARPKLAAAGRCDAALLVELDGQPLRAVVHRHRAAVGHPAQRRVRAKSPSA